MSFNEEIYTEGPKTGGGGGNGPPGPPGPPGSVGPVTQIAVSTIFNIGWSVRIAKQKIFIFKGIVIFICKTQKCVDS